MTSDFQLAANRANALKSTGPATPEGRAAAARNALAHGLTSSVVLHPGDDPAQFTLFRDMMFTDLAPDCPVELFIADRIIANAWRLRRVVGIESLLHVLTPPQSADAPDHSVHPDPSAPSEPASPLIQMTLAWINDSKSENFRKLNRHESHINAIFTRDLDAYLKRRQIREDAARELARLEAQAARPAEPAPKPPLMNRLNDLLLELEGETDALLKKQESQLNQ